MLLENSVNSIKFLVNTVPPTINHSHGTRVVGGRAMVFKTQDTLDFIKIFNDAFDSIKGDISTFLDEIKGDHPLQIDINIILNYKDFFTRTGHTTSFDASNFIKILEDCIKERLYNDDSNTVIFTSRKSWTFSNLPCIPYGRFTKEGITAITITKKSYKDVFVDDIGKVCDN